MGFDDLPPGWDTQPLTDPRLVADVLDLFVSEQARYEGALCLLLCDAGDRLRMPLMIGELADAGDHDGRVEMLAGLLRGVRDIDPDVGVLAALARTGGLSVTADDKSWADALAASASAAAVRLLGVHVVTPDGSRPVPRASRAA